MAVTNVISGHKDIITLFWENKLGVDVDVCVTSPYFTHPDIHHLQDHYRIIIFEGSECLKNGAQLKSHLTLVDGPYRPSDRFLRFHFQQCLGVSACRGDITEGYEEQEIENNSMEELGELLVSMFMEE